jgi:hypothetical protein
MQPLVIIGIDYDEGDQSTYRAVTATYIGSGDSQDTVKRYAAGDAEADFEKAITEALEQTQDIMLSSSTDSFVMDGEQYKFSDQDMIVKV